MFSFKRADESEAHIIRELAEETWPLTYQHILSKEQISYMFEMMYNEEEIRRQITSGVFYYFVYQNDKIAGFAALQMTNSAIAKLDKIYILPRMQGSGAGKALILFILNKSRSLGASSLVLNVNRNNKARFFYERIGFLIKEEKDIPIGNGFFMNDYLMYYELNDV